MIYISTVSFSLVNYTPSIKPLRRGGDFNLNIILQVSYLQKWAIFNKNGVITAYHTVTLILHMYYLYVNFVLYLVFIKKPEVKYVNA